MPRIFDCFTFYNEEDVLRIRLEELAPVVDKFVIVESDKTFRGEPKPYYTYDYDWLKEYSSQLIVAHFNRPAFFPDAWAREIKQRNHILDVLKGLFPKDVQPDDTIIISDVDEIPRRSIVEPVDEIKRLRMLKFSYGLNMLTEEGNTSARMLPYRLLTTPQEIRKGEGAMIEDAGWEFSSLGTPEQILNKIKSFSHSEFDTPDLTVEALAARIAGRQDIVGRDMYHSVVPIDDTWPEAVKADPEKWSKYIWPLA